MYIIYIYILYYIYIYEYLHTYINTKPCIHNYIQMIWWCKKSEFFSSVKCAIKASAELRTNAQRFAPPNSRLAGFPTTTPKAALEHFRHQFVCFFWVSLSLTRQATTWMAKTSARQRTKSAPVVRTASSVSWHVLALADRAEQIPEPWGLFPRHLWWLVVLRVNLLWVPLELRCRREVLLPHVLHTWRLGETWHSHICLLRVDTVNKRWSTFWWHLGSTSWVFTSVYWGRDQSHRIVRISMPHKWVVPFGRSVRCPAAM